MRREDRTHTWNDSLTGKQDIFFKDLAGIVPEDN